jgi:hypothetical protein
MKTKELQGLQPELTEVVKSSKMDLNKAEVYAIGYMPFMKEVTEQNNIIKGLDKTNPDDAAKAKRASLDLGKIISKATDKKKEDKEDLLLTTKHIDNLFNLVESTGRLGQSDAKEIFTYAEKIESERLEKIASERTELLSSYGEVNKFVDLRSMDEDTFNKYLGTEKLAFETREEQARLAELQRIEDERLAEEQRVKAEQEKQAEQERIKKENEVLKEKEVIRQKRFAEMQPIAIVIRDFNGMIELPEDEYKKQLADHKIGYQQHIEFQIEQENKKREQEAKERQDELAKIEMNAKIKAKQDAEKELQQKEKARIEAEESEKLAKEKAALLAPDKEKVKVFFGQFDALKFPELSSEQGKAMEIRIKDALSIVRKLIIEDSKTLL